jgi:hypothetical protein
VTDPKRLIDENNLGATLLASARSDAPWRSARDRTAAALGLAASTAAVTSASATAGATGVDGAVRVGADVAGKSTSTATWIKIVGGVLVVGALAGGAYVATGGSSAKHSAATSVPAPPTTVRAQETESVATSGLPADAIARRLPAPQSGAEQYRSKAHHASPDPAAESALARELRLLDAARSALDRHDVADALATLDRYERAFPSGTLRTEASMLRVEALLARGDGVEARKLARDLLAQDPLGPHARRLRTIADSP